MPVATSKLASSAVQRRYLREPIPVRFPESACVPESGIRLRLRTALWSMLRLACADRAMIGSDQFLYWDPTDPRQCLAPDILVWLGTPDRPFASWKVWERGAPHLAVEIVGASDATDRAWERKLDAYRHAGVHELARFDAEDARCPLRLWDRVEGDLVEREISKTELERSDVLELFWLIEPDPELGLMLRLSRDAAGRERLLTEAEAHRAAEVRVSELEAELARRSAR